jgi:hypothetical protein
MAEQYFPKLDNPAGISLEVEDAHGETYTLRWRWVLQGRAPPQHKGCNVRSTAVLGGGRPSASLGAARGWDDGMFALVLPT